MSVPFDEPGASPAPRADGALALGAGGDPVRLRDYVRIALERYFEALDGHESGDLFRLVMREVEEPLFEAVLAHSGGSRTKAAQMLGISRGTLRRKIEQYRLG